MKLILRVSPLLFLLFSLSCNNIKKQEENKVTDTIAVNLSALNKKIVNDPNNAELYHLRAKYHFKNKDFNSALSDMNRVLKLDSTKASYYLTLSEIYFVGNKTSKSKEALEKCIALDPKNTEALMKLGELFFYVRKYEESIEYLNKVLKEDVHNSKAYFLKGMNYAEKGDTVHAVSSMQTAVEQNPDYYTAYIQLGILLATKKDRLAIDYYNNAIKLQPKSTEAFYDKAKFFQDVQMWNEAISTYNQLLTIDSMYAEAYYNLGAIDLLSKKDYKSALMHFDGAVKSNEKYAAAYYARGTCYLKLGEKNKAVADFKTTLQLEPGYEPALKAMENIR